LAIETSLSYYGTAASCAVTLGTEMRRLSARQPIGVAQGNSSAKQNLVTIPSSAFWWPPSTVPGWLGRHEISARRSAKPDALKLLFLETEGSNPPANEVLHLAVS